MYIKKYLKNNKKILYIYITLLIFGILFGIIAFSKININEKEDITSLYKNSFLLENIDKSNKVMEKIFIDNLKEVILIIFMGLFVLGKYTIILNGFFIGFKLGINSSILYSLLNQEIWKKIILSYSIVNFIYIFFYTVISIFNYKFSNNLSELIEEENKRENLIRFALYNFIISIIGFLPIVFESRVIEKIINNITK